MKLQALSMLTLSAILASCNSTSQPAAVDQAPAGPIVAYRDTSVQIDASILSGAHKLEAQSLTVQGRNANTLMRTEQGDIEFFSREMIVKKTDQAAFDAFLKKYNGTVLRDGTFPAPVLSGAEKGNRLRTVPQGVWQLVQIDAPPVGLDVVVKKLNQLNFKGTARFPDQATANLYYASLAARDEFGLSTETNYVMRPTGATGNDRDGYLSSGGQMTPASNWAFQKTGVVRAWEEFGVTGYIPDVGIIDTGFKPNDYELTGYNPITGAAPVYPLYKGNITNQQYDFPENDRDVTSYDGDPDANNTTWHGHQVAQVALGASNNQYGASGVAPGAWPYLYRLGRGIGNALSYYDAGRAVDMAIASGVDVINMSFGALTPAGAGIPNTYLGAALDRAAAAGVVNVAAAGNDNRYEYEARYPWFLYPVPAVWTSVIAVGATDQNDRRSFWGTQASNYGPFVDIWAPGTSIPIGHRPSASCYNGTGLFCAGTGLSLSYNSFDGTSAAAPFVAGAIALMRDANMSLNQADVVKILQATSNKFTPDADVNGVGRINVYEAVKMAKTYVR